ncbi:MAG: helix-turn-helix transcriptional regulator [Bacteroidales bacterium]|nr:helix-turn-helix transcriptional regulator [Bacteroidales bacterium]
MQYIYPPDIFDHSPERLLKVLSSDFRRRRLEKGMSRKHLSDLSGVPAPTIAKFERQNKISLESFARCCISMGYFDELSKVLSSAKYRTLEELEAIQNNYYRVKGR